MIFPLEIKYTKRLVGKIEEIPTQGLLDSYKIDFEKSGADIVRLIDKTVIAENKLFKIHIRPGLNWNRWGGISYAKVQIIESDKRRNAIYVFNLTRIFVVGAIAGVFFGIISKFFWVGIVAFIVLGIFNWLVKLLQHWITFSALINK